MVFVQALLNLSIIINYWRMSNMKRNREVACVIFLILGVLFLTGCNDSSDSKSETDPPTPHPEALVSAEWVKDLIDGKNPETYPGEGYVIVFTSWWPRWETNEISTTGAGTPFATEGHIPGAIFLDTYSVETGPTSEYGDGYASPSDSYVKALPILQAFFASMGINKDKTVVVYADDDISMMTAGRIAWALLS